MSVVGTSLSDLSLSGFFIQGGISYERILNSTLPTQNNHSEKNKPDGVFVIKQGKTNYKVKVFFDHSSGLTAEDRLKRIIQAEAERESA